MALSLCSYSRLACSYLFRRKCFVSSSAVDWLALLPRLELEDLLDIGGGKERRNVSIINVSETMSLTRANIKNQERIQKSSNNKRKIWKSQQNKLLMIESHVLTLTPKWKGGASSLGGSLLNQFRTFGSMMLL